MAENGRQEREPVGSVAEETVRLVEALGGWAEGLRAHNSDGAHDSVGAHDSDGAHHGDGTHDGDPARGSGPADGDRAHDGGRAGRGSDDRQAGTRHTTRCEHCGASSRAGEAVACQLCPVCQGIALLRTVRPETVERLADLAAALSGALRDIAADRFAQPPSAPPPPPPRGQRVQDIAVDDEDEPSTPAPDRPRRTQEKTAP